MKPALRRTGLALFSLGVALVAANAALARWYPLPVHMYATDPRLIYRPIPGARSVTTEIDAQGFRAGGQTEGRRRVVVYGDSFAFAQDAPVEDTFAERLAAVNAGVVGYGPDQACLRMEQEFDLLRPERVVLVLCSANDFGDLVRNKLFALDAAGKAVPNPVVFAPELLAEFEAKARAAEGLALVRAWRRWRAESEERARIAAGGVQPPWIEWYLAQAQDEYREYVVEGQLAVRQVWQDYYDADLAIHPEWDSSIYKRRLMRAVLERMRDACAKRSVPFVALIVPSAVDLCPSNQIRVDPARYPGWDPARLCGTLAQILEELAVPHVNLYEPFRAAGADGLYIGGGNMHWNAKGQELAARVLKEFLSSGTRVTNSAELKAALAAAKPGARILLAPGDYETLQAANVQGAAGQPIVLAAEDREKRPVFRGGVQLSDAAWLELRDLVIEGAPHNGLNLDDGGSFETPAHHLLLSGLLVRDCGRDGNEDGIKLSGLDDFRLENCTVERWGRGGSAIDMVGCHRGTLEGCTIRDREEQTASSGVQMKGGTSEVALRACRFEHAGTRAVNAGGSTGLAYFRPRPEGFEARALSIEGCTFLGSEAPIAFVGVDGASVRWNTFYRPRKWFARILQETRETGFVPCRGGVFSDNLVAYLASEVGTAVNVGPGTAPESFEFARNYWYCIDAPARSRPTLPTPEKESAGGDDPRFLDAEKGDLRLSADSPARAHGASAWPGAKK